MAKQKTWCHVGNLWSQPALPFNSDRPKDHFHLDLTILTTILHQGVDPHMLLTAHWIKSQNIYGAKGLGSLTHQWSHNVPQSCIHKLPAYTLVHFSVHTTSSSPLLSTCIRKHILNFLLQKHWNVPGLPAHSLAQLTLSCSSRFFILNELTSQLHGEESWRH